MASRSMSNVYCIKPDDGETIDHPQIDKVARPTAGNSGRG
jgi:hypothetical protein